MTPLSRYPLLFVLDASTVHNAVCAAFSQLFSDKIFDRHLCQCQTLRLLHQTQHAFTCKSFMITMDKFPKPKRKPLRRRVAHHGSLSASRHWVSIDCSATIQNTRCQFKRSALSTAIQIPGFSNEGASTKQQACIHQLCNCDRCSCAFHA